MRLSTITVLWSAPLALAGTMQQTNHSTEVSIQQQGKGKHDRNRKSLLGSVDEVIVIWTNQGGGAATSTVTNTVIVTASSGTSVAAATHSVTVGGAAGLKYSPHSIKATVGDMVVFTFNPLSLPPCVKLADGMDSGFIANINDTVVPAPQMAMQVTVATPIWFYCRQKGHCGKGMAFSVNPTANKTQAMFQQMAMAQNGTGTASPITGGTANSGASTNATAATGAGTNATATNGMATGTGNVSNGTCSCSCLCGIASFPNAAVQGIGAYGGMSGAVPISAIAA